MGKYKRNTIIDTAKVVAIICMILGHCRYFRDLCTFCESFHMPLFLLMGGYFFKERKTIEIIKKGTKRLLIPACTVGLIIAAIYLLFDDWNGWYNRILAFIYPDNTRDTDMLIHRHMPDMGAMWFLFALFWTRIYYNITYRYIKSGGGNPVYNTLIYCSFCWK